MFRSGTVPAGDESKLSYFREDFTAYNTLIFSLMAWISVQHEVFFNMLFFLQRGGSANLVPCRIAQQQPTVVPVLG